MRDLKNRVSILRPIYLSRTANVHRQHTRVRDLKNRVSILRAIALSRTANVHR
ncbi:hypothetical protein CKA32_007009 [Geitlerinema sp. FC II]|nr:hypothetical protein CKA32_007009 [Geitlerinema sp. FC II]